MNESIDYTHEVDSNIVELIVDTFIDNEEVVVENNVNEEQIDYDYQINCNNTIGNNSNEKSTNNNNNNNNNNNKKRKKGKQADKTESNGGMHLFPIRTKTSENDVYVFDLQLSALQLEVDFSKLTFICLAKHLRTEQLAFIFAIKLGLINVEPGKCRKCGQKMYLTQQQSIKAFHEFRCRRPCRTKLSVLENSCFSNSHAEISQILTAFYCWCLSLNTKHAEFQCQLSLAAVIDFYKLCRRVCLQTLINNCVTNKTIGGFGLTVEIGTTSCDKVIKSKNCRKTVFKTIKNDKKYVKTVEKQPFIETNQFIFIGICRETKECFVTQISEQTLDVVLPLIVQNVSNDSIIVTNLGKTIPTLEPELESLGFNKCKTTQTVQKTHFTFIEHCYYIKYPSDNPGIKYETILNHMSQVFPGAFLNQV